MDTPTLILIFFALCGVGILLSLAAPASRQGNVLAWLGCLASHRLGFGRRKRIARRENIQRAAVDVAGIGGDAHIEN